MMDGYGKVREHLGFLSRSRICRKCSNPMPRLLCPSVLFKKRSDCINERVAFFYIYFHLTAGSHFFARHHHAGDNVAWHFPWYAQLFLRQSHFKSIRFFRLWKDADLYQMSRDSDLRRLLLAVRSHGLHSECIMDCSLLQ
jgi:hypothetical protein